MSKAHPTPWELVGHTIRDANGGVVVSAINPCGMGTRKMIVAAANVLPTMNEALECAKKKALYISRNYSTPNSLTGNMLELLAYLNAAIAATESVQQRKTQRHDEGDQP